ncbi:ABC transporter permease [Mesorhizobium xinjiangense]|uniref:ABC transporter permease n=1 Tax=Mesorhizobium xinjiangense TaxID=2678685 RepID=UPI001F17BD01|nr:ABC transporter permease [Mesorhizobium xinjiangense]
MAKVIASALADIGAGLKMRRVWMALAQEDIGDQHRRTALGPVWLLLNYLAFAGTFIFVFQRGDSSAPHYAAYVATGLLVWFYIMETLTQSVTLFVREENFIKGTTLPLSVYIMRMATQSVMRAGYALIGCLAILAMSDVAFTPMWAWSALAVLLIIFTAPAAITTFAFLGGYFPDSQFLVSNLMRIGMFLTPVFWTPGGHGIRNAFYYFNPFTYFLEIVRIPIIAANVPVRSFIFCAIISALLWGVALILLGRLRKQVVFVL